MNNFDKKLMPIVKDCKFEQRLIIMKKKMNIIKGIETKK